MDEIVPGVYHWSAFHEGIRQPVHSYFVAGARALLDPMLLDEGLDWFEGERRPERILLTNRHHYRHSHRFVDAFGCPVLAPEVGLHEFEGGPEVQGFAFGDEVAPGIVAHEVGGICPDESALHLEREKCLACADGVIELGGELSFVPDQLMDDPEKDKAGMRDSYRRLLELDFENLLMAHGAPVVGDGKAALKAFVD
jgi:glyoxylase-like metal-dependent hydrolase (beta-lactamase superfamily II)